MTKSSIPQRTAADPLTRPLARALPANSDGDRHDVPAPLIGPRLAAELRAMEVRLDEASQRVLAADDDLAVHDLRVAIRRTRTLLEIGRDVFGRYHADEVRRAFAELQRATGALRDEEVLLEIVAALPLPTSELQDWIATRERRERRLRGGLRQLIRHGAIAHGLTLLNALLAFRVKGSRNKRLAKFARRAVEEAVREVDKRRSARDEDMRALHRLRIAYKRLRYTTETFADVLPVELSALARTAAGFQKRIGEVHDLEVATDRIRLARALPDASRRSVLAAVAQLRTKHEASLLEELGWHRPQSEDQLSGADSLRKISMR